MNLLTPHAWEAISGRPLGGPQVWAATNLADAVDAAIRGWLGRHVTAQLLDEYQPVHRGALTVLPDWPIGEDVVITDGGAVVEWYDAGMGAVIRRTGRWRTPEVSGTVGYDEVPGWATLAAVTLAEAWMGASALATASAGGPVRSETIVDHSVTFDTTAATANVTLGMIPTPVLAILAPHRRPVESLWPSP